MLPAPAAKVVCHCLALTTLRPGISRLKRKDAPPGRRQDSWGGFYGHGWVGRGWGGLGWIRPAMGGGVRGSGEVLVGAAHGGPHKQLRTHRRQRGFPKLLIDTTFDVFSHSRFLPISLAHLDCIQQAWIQHSDGSIFMWFTDFHFRVFYLLATLW